MFNYTKENLEKPVKDSKCYAAVCRLIGVKPFTGAQTYLKKKIVEFELDTSHFTGQAWNRGKVFPKKLAAEYCFNGSTVNSHKLKQLLFRDNLKIPACEICSIQSWQGKPVVLELDHINSDHFNNELSNLQILCPNCHAMVTRERKPPKKPKVRKERKPKALKKKGDPNWRTKSKLSQRKVERPPIEVLLKEVEDTSYLAVGKKYGVSDNAVRKWIRHYGYVPVGKLVKSPRLGRGVL